MFRQKVFSVTKAERERLSRLKGMPCIACGDWGVDIHHICDKGYRKHSGGHMATINLCPWCHRGMPHWGVPISQMMLIVGPSLALNKREFVRVYGSERELLAKVDALLAGRKAA